MALVRAVDERKESTEFEIMEADLAPRPSEAERLPNPLTKSSDVDLRRYQARLGDVARARSAAEPEPR